MLGYTHVRKQMEIHVDMQPVYLFALFVTDFVFMLTLRQQDGLQDVVLKMPT